MIVIDYSFTLWLSGADLRGVIGTIAPKTYRSNFICHDFAQFGKQHLR